MSRSSPHGLVDLFPCLVLASLITPFVGFSVPPLPHLMTLSFRSIKRLGHSRIDALDFLLYMISRVAVAFTCVLTRMERTLDVEQSLDYTRGQRRPSSQVEELKACNREMEEKAAEVSKSNEKLADDKGRLYALARELENQLDIMKKASTDMVEPSQLLGI